MTLAERLPSLDDVQLTNLRANAVRLQAANDRRGDEAAELIPLIEAELAQRSAAKPPKAAPRKRRVQPTVAA